MRRRVFILGNSMIEQDSMPIYILTDLKRQLSEIEFVHIDPTEGLVEVSGKDLILIDTVIGIKKVTCFTNLDKWYRSPRVTVHDFDLPLELGIMQKLGKIKSVYIIGIPPHGDRKKIVSQVVNMLKAI